VLHETLPNSFFHLHSNSYEFSKKWIIASSLTALIGWIAQPGIVAAVGSGKTELESRVGYTYGAMIKRACAIAWTFTGAILVAIGVMLAMRLAKVADALTMLLTFSSIMGVTVWAGVIWKRANSAGAWAAVIVLFTMWTLYGPVGALIKSATGAGPAWLGKY